MKGSGKFVVGGNWKCNGNTGSIAELVASLNASKVTADVEIICAPPMLYLPSVQSTLNGTRFQIAAQNCWVNGGGAFTGEVSAEMLVDARVPWVILGHSERRSLCGESNEFTGKKVKHALGVGLRVIACVGETLAQRENGTTLDVCFAQLKAVADEIQKSDWANVVIAYEPVWAIGTGKVATPEQAQDVHAALRGWVHTHIGSSAGDAIRIQYGGSVNAGNCVELAGKEDIDGFLVGGASLKAEDFIKICNAASAHYDAVRLVKA